MKPNLLIIASISLFLLTSFKGIVPDQRIIEYMGQEKVDMLLKNNPDLIRYYNFFLDNSYIISDVPADKLSENNFPVLELPLKDGKVDTNKLNVLKLDIQRRYDEKLYFKVKNSNEVFIFLSEKEFMKKYNSYRREMGLITE